MIPMTNEFIFYDTLPIAKKKVIKTMLLKHKELFKREKEIIENCLLKALNEKIRLVDRVLINGMDKIDINYYVKRQKYLSNYIRQFMKGDK